MKPRLSTWEERITREEMHLCWMTKEKKYQGQGDTSILEEQGNCLVSRKCFRNLVCPLFQLITLYTHLGHVYWADDQQRKLQRNQREMQVSRCLEIRGPSTTAISTKQMKTWRRKRKRHLERVS
jgi:hypothetical protein